MSGPTIDLRTMRGGTAHRLYLRNQELEALSDATVVCGGGERLPVHTAFLAAASPVLHSAIMGDPGKSAIEIATPFQRFSHEVVSVFLAFVYHTHEPSGPNLEAVAHLLPDVVRLAHRLDVKTIVSAINKHVWDTGDVPMLVEFLDVVEECKMDVQRRWFFERLAGLFITPNSVSAADRLLVASRLAPDSIAQLLGMSTIGSTEVQIDVMIKDYDALKSANKLSDKMPSVIAGGQRWSVGIAACTERCKWGPFLYRESHMDRRQAVKIRFTTHGGKRTNTLEHAWVYDNVNNKAHALDLDLGDVDKYLCNGDMRATLWLTCLT